MIRLQLSMRDLTYTISMSIACLLSYWLTTRLLSSLVAREDDLLGGMWAAIAAAFVFRNEDTNPAMAGAQRLGATLVSFVLCLAYLSLAPPTAAGMAMIVAVGAVILRLLNHRDEIITMAITTIVVMVVAAINPETAGRQPLLRLIDTLVGVAVGIACSWSASRIIARGRS
jgi:uncharacterized membrane protein YccC